ncbi:MAG TPA: transcriptional repressor [Rhodospirillaceae bacterium]|nr:transcriptional repressor [Rhodospirillaceae bacterium]
MPQKQLSFSLQDRRILTLLRRAKKPLSAYTLLDQLRPEGVRSPPTVYRALDRLLACGVVHRLESLNAFMACAYHADDGAKGHLSAFAICATCGRAWEIHDPTLARTIKKIGKKFFTQPDQEVIEISGLCASCEKKQKNCEDTP